MAVAPYWPVPKIRMYVPAGRSTPDTFCWAGTPETGAETTAFVPPALSRAVAKGNVVPVPTAPEGTAVRFATEKIAPKNELPLSGTEAEVAMLSTWDGVFNTK